MNEIADKSTRLRQVCQLSLSLIEGPGYDPRNLLLASYIYHWKVVKGFKRGYSNILTLIYLRLCLLNKGEWKATARNK